MIKNKRKIMSIILVIVLLIMNMPVFANESVELTNSQKTAGEVLKEYGLLDGNEEGDLMEDKELTRAELMVIIAQLNGVKQEAQEFSSFGQFSDVTGTEWYAPYVSYAEVQEWTNGYPDGTFKPEKTVSSQELAKFMLNVLGYKDVPWEQTLNEAKKHNIVSNETNKETVKRGESFNVMLQTLNTKPANSQNKLGEDLGVEKFIVDTIEEENEERLEEEISETTLYIDSVVALTDDILKITLDSEEDAPTVVNERMFSITDKDNEIIDIQSADFAEWDEDDYTILIFTEELDDNTIYTLETKNEERTFRGIEEDEDEANLINVFSTKYNKILLTFDKPMTRNIDVDIEEKYNDNDSLSVDYIEYGNNPYELEIETGEQSSGTLYELKITSGSDLFNIDLDDITKTFSGKDKPDGDLEIENVIAEDFETVIITFKDNMEIEERTISISDFEIEETYSKDEVDVLSAELLKDSSNYTLVNEANEDSAIVLKTSELEASTLYKLEISNIESIYDTDIDNDNDTKTFVGKDIPDEDFGYTVKSIANTTIEITFDNKVNSEALKIDNYEIESKYFNDNVEIESIIKENDKVFNIEVSELENSLYEITVENIEDLYGNDIDSDEKSQTFVGRDKEDGISKITNITRTSDTKIEVTFDKEAYRNDAQDISNYRIDNEIGYPIVAKLLDDLKTVELTIPETEEGVLYKLTVEDIRNTDKVDMEDSEITGSFTGKGLSKTLPKIEGVIAENAYTLKIYFDKDVLSDQIDSVLWNSETNQLLGNIDFKEEDDNNYLITLADAGQEYVSAFDDNVLKITYPTKVFDELSNSDTYFIRVSDSYIDEDENEKEFAGSSDEKLGPRIEAVQGLDKNSILVYTTEDLDVSTVINALGEITVERTGYSENPINAYKSNTNQYILIMPTAMDNDVYTLKISQETADNDGVLDIEDVNNQFVLYDELEDNSSYAVDIDFAGVDKEANNVIDDVDAITLNNRTVKVYFNDVLELGSNVTDPTKYNLITENDLPYTTFTNSLSPDYVEYDSSTKTAKLFYTQDIGTENGLARYIVFDNLNEIVDKSGLRKVEEENGDILKVQYALNTSMPNEPRVIEAKLSDSGDIITLIFNESVAYTDNLNNVVFDNDDTIAYYEFENLNTDTSKTYETTKDLSNWFDVSGTLDAGGSLDIFKAERMSDKKVKIYLNGQAEVASKITVNSNTIGIYDIINRTNTSLTPENDVDNELDIEIAVPYSLGSGEDYLPPTITNAVVEDSSPTDIVITVSESVTITDETGFTINGTTGNVTGVTGSGTNTLTFTLDSQVISTETITIDYDKSLGDVADEASTPNELETFNGQSVTNNVSNQAPTASNQTDNGKVGDLYSLDLETIFIDDSDTPANLTYSIVGDDGDATATLNANTIEYTPTTIDRGNDVIITVNAQDTEGAISGNITITLSITEDVVFSNLVANGTSNTVDTTILTVTLDKDIDLVQGDVTLTGATLDSLTDENDNTYSLNISNIPVTDGANVNVALSKAGYVISPDNMDVAINVDTTAPTVASATVENASPAEIVVTMSETVTITNETGFTINGTTGNITGVTGSETDTLTFTLSSSVVNGETITIDYDKSLGNVVDASSTPSELETFNGQSVTNNVSNQAPTASNQIDNGKVGDLYSLDLETIFTDDSDTPANLTYSIVGDDGDAIATLNTNTVEYTPTAIDRGNDVIITVTAEDTEGEISGNITITLSITEDVVFSNLEANGTSNTLDTTILTVTLDKDIDLVQGDVTLTGATLDSLTDENDNTYSLNISNIPVTDGANINVALSKAGYVISPDNMDVTINVDTTAPTVASATVENASPAEIVVTMSETVIITNETGFTVNGTTGNITGVTGSGTDTLTFTLNSSVVNGETVTINYDKSSGDVADEADTPNELETFSNQAVENKV